MCNTEILHFVILEAFRVGNSQFEINKVYLSLEQKSQNSFCDIFETCIHLILREQWTSYPTYCYLRLHSHCTLSLYMILQLPRLWLTSRQAGCPHYRGWTLLGGRNFWFVSPPQELWNLPLYWQTFLLTLLNPQLVHWNGRLDEPASAWTEMFMWTCHWDFWR